MSSEREKLLEMARLSEQVERYDEMLVAMKKIVVLGGELSTEERRMLALAYKSEFDARRTSCRAMAQMIHKEEDRGEMQKVKTIKTYRSHVEEELHNICSDILDLLDNHLIPNTSQEKVKVFYLKMKGDYYRYMAAFVDNSERQDAGELSLIAYTNAYEIAKNSLPPTDPLLLGLVLNFSVFFFDIVNRPDKACYLAKYAFDEAIAQLDTLSEETYKESTVIMQLLRDNYTLWSKTLPDNSEKSNEVN